MVNDSCPYCKEKIKANAILCKHCHTRLRYTREEMILSAIATRLGSRPYLTPQPMLSAYLASPPTFDLEATPCKAICSTRHPQGGEEYKNCVKECELADTIAVVVERLSKDLFDICIEEIWGGGHIDTIPFEKSVRERFSRPRDKRRVRPR